MSVPKFEAPKPPRIPSVGEELDKKTRTWDPSEDPFKGRFVDQDDEGPEPEPLFEDCDVL